MAKRVDLQEVFYARLEEKKTDSLKYMLNKLGFYDSKITDEFLEQLYISVFEKHKNGKMIYDYDSNWGDFVKFNDDDFARLTYNEIVEEYVFKRARVVREEYRHPNIDHRVIHDFLLDERKIDYVTASDISSYFFCLASYCIKKTFSEYEKNEDAEIGTEMHEQNKLLSFVAGSKNKYSISGNVTNEGLYSENNKEFFDDVRNSTIFYVGHDNESKKYFLSSKGRFVGQPDYVFTNAQGKNYVVEEKFRSLNKQIKSLRKNHKAQLLSYIVALNELRADYGYLVYWYYSYEDKQRVIKKCTVFKVEKSDDLRQEIREAYISILELNSGMAFDFDANELEAAKCANCVVKRFCGHKTGRLSQVSIPYDIEYFGLTAGGLNGWF